MKGREDCVLRTTHVGLWGLRLSQVRGAYIVIENERAAAQGYPSPIHDCIEDTHVNYDRCAAALAVTLRSLEASTRG